MADPHTKKARKNQLVFAFVSLVLLYSLGVFGAITSYITGDSETVVTVTQKVNPEGFVVVAPTGNVFVSTKTGSTAIGLKNIGPDLIEITDITVANNKMPCLVTGDYPLFLDPRKVLNATVLDCAPKDAVAGNNLTLLVTIKGSATMQSVLLTDPLAQSFKDGRELDRETQKRLNEQEKANMKRMNAARTMMNFTSRGEVSGTYT